MKSLVKRMSDLMMSKSIKKRKQSRQMVVEKRLHVDGDYLTFDLSKLSNSKLRGSYDS